MPRCTLIAIQNPVIRKPGSMPKIIIVATLLKVIFSHVIENDIQYRIEKQYPCQPRYIQSLSREKKQ